MILIASALSIALNIAVIYGAMYLANRFLHRYMAVAIGIAATVFAIYAMVDTVVTCGAEPEYVPPLPGSDGDGAMIYPCDGPNGPETHAVVILIWPITALLCALRARWYWRSADTKRPHP